MSMLYRFNVGSFNKMDGDVDFDVDSRESLTCYGFSDGISKKSCVIYLLSVILR